MNAARGVAGLSASVVILLSAACGRGGAVDSGFVMRDSAGIVIVENARPAWQPGEAWRLSDEPVLQIGSVGGAPEYVFGRAHGPVRLSDGRIVVADMQTNLMSFYDAEGTFLRSAGGSGDGPGEFRQLYRLRKVAGDSLMALNPTSLTSIFTNGGEYVRRFSLDPVPGRGNIWWIGPLDGALMAMSLQREGTRIREPPAGLEPGQEYPRFDIPERHEFYRDSLLFFLYTMEGQLIDSLFELPGQYLSTNRTFAPNAAYAFLGDAFHHSPGSVTEIRTLRLALGALGGGAGDAGAAEAGTGDGNAEGSGVQAREPMRLERIVRRVPLRDLSVTEDVRNAYLEDERAQIREMAERLPPGQVDLESMERRLADMRFPERIPDHGNRMYVDALGNLWLQDYRLLDDEPFRWSVFDSAGRWLGVVETPPRFTVNEIGSDHVLGIWRDELDVDYVRMYALEKEGIGAARR